LNRARLRTKREELFTTCREEKRHDRNNKKQILIRKIPFRPRTTHKIHGAGTKCALKHYRSLKQRGDEAMRMITLMGTAAAALTAATLLVTPASADRVCRQSCDDGFCRTRCFDHGDRLYMYDRDRDDYYYHRHRPGIGVYGPGFGVDIGR
jgi:hypothetical protein